MVLSVGLGRVVAFVWGLGGFVGGLFDGVVGEVVWGMGFMEWLDGEVERAVLVLLLSIW